MIVIVGLIMSVVVRVVRLFGDIVGRERWVGLERGSGQGKRGNMAFGIGDGRKLGGDRVRIWLGWAGWIGMGTGLYDIVLVVM